ncbi:MAG: hypothetical protein JXA71_13245, partial [Chitinispirillaceae bacterium]|nr:hypothetical protein [Chitinispirillaceae bacterium]
SGLLVLATGAIAATATTREVPVTFTPATGGTTIIREQMQGTCLPIWNSKQLYNEIRRGLATARYSLLRFPNGSLSNDYHWNGSGSYTADGMWECDSADYKPGFMSQLKYRGTSKNHYGFSGASAITDGDTATMWWSDPLLTESKPYFYLEFTPSVRADSIVIHWGRHYGVDFVVQRWGSPGASSTPPYQAASSLWITVGSVTDATGGMYAGSLDSGDATGYFRVMVTRASGDSGWQVRELYLYNKDSLVSRNIKNYTGANAASQTNVVALGTHGGTVVRADWATGWVNWDFESFIAYCDSFPYTTIPIISVNYGTGTPEEAARWVHYANKVRNLGIRFWQVGNEMDGYWEEAGPVDAAMYAEKFLRFSKAMKAVDSTIKVFGPVLSTADFKTQASGGFDNLSFMESFLKRVGEQERADTATWLDGIDFHSYPYWFGGSPVLATMIDRSDFLWSRSDTLKAMMGRRLANPDSLFVCLSEFNMSVVMASMLQEPINGVCVANLFATFAEKFGPRAMSVVWDSYENLAAGPNGTWGSLSLFNPGSGRALSSMTRSPAAIYWPLFMAGRLWLAPGAENHVSPPQYDRSSKVRAFGVTSNGSFRALLLNLSSDTIMIDPAMTAGSYRQVDVYSWSGREFRWNGTGADAYALPDCGPSSMSVAADSLDAIRLLPLSCVVAEWHNGKTGNAAPAFLHTGRNGDKVRGSDSLRFWGTVLDSVSPIARLTVAVDSNATMPLSVLDGAVDGPSESWSTAIAARDLGLGIHRFVVAAENGKGTIARDTFTVTVGDTLRPTLLIDDFEDRDLVCALSTRASWNSYHAGTPDSYLNLGWDTSGASGSATALRADFSIEKPALLPHDVYGSVFLNLDTVFMDTVRPKLIGITFRYATASDNPGGTFILQVQSTPVRDYDYFTIRLANTNGAWRTVTAEWRDIRQDGWGTPIDSLSVRQIRRLEFRTVMGGTGFLSLDNLSFISDSGASILPVTRGKVVVPHRALSVLTRPDGRVLFTWAGQDRAATTVRIFNARGVTVHSSGVL